MFKIDCVHYWDISEDELDIPSASKDVIIEAGHGKTGQYFVIDGEVCNSCERSESCKDYNKKD